MARRQATTKQKPSPKSRQSTKPSEPPQATPTTPEDLLRQGVERAKRALRGETSDLRRKP